MKFDAKKFIESQKVLKKGGYYLIGGCYCARYCNKKFFFSKNKMLCWKKHEI